MSLFDRPSPGLTVHLRHMHMVLDPSSSDYLSHIHFENDTAQEEARYTIGAQRTPTGRNSRNFFLWRPLDLPGWSFAQGGLHHDIMALYDCAATHIERTEEMMLAAGKKLYDAAMSNPFSSEDDTEDADIYRSPFWQQTASVYFQLACRLPYLRQVQALVTACNVPGITPDSVPVPLFFVIYDLRADLVKHRHRSLKDTVEIGRLYKEKGNKIMRGATPDYTHAIAMYAMAITHVLPWFPCDYHMAPWEARISGVADVVVQCNINLAIAVMRGFSMLKSAFHILEAVSPLSCVTNWQKAKILHLQATCVERVITGSVIDDCEWELNPEPMTKDVFYYFSTRNIYLDGIENGLAQRSWITEFTPDFFADHYLLLCERLDPEKVKWWEMERSKSADNMRTWLARTQYLERLSEAEQAGREEDMDLEHSNDKLAHLGNQWWEYRV